MQIHSSFNVWQRHQIKKGAKPRHKTGGAKRVNWAYRKPSKCVCFVKTRND
jgi:hypothetical protein